MTGLYAASLYSEIKRKTHNNNQEIVNVKMANVTAIQFFRHTHTHTSKKKKNFDRSLALESAAAIHCTFLFQRVLFYNQIIIISLATGYTFHQCLYLLRMKIKPPSKKEKQVIFDLFISRANRLVACKFGSGTIGNGSPFIYLNHEENICIRHRVPSERHLLLHH